MGRSNYRPDQSEGIWDALATRGLKIGDRSFDPEHVFYANTAAGTPIVASEATLDDFERHIILARRKPRRNFTREPRFLKCLDFPLEQEDLHAIVEKLAVQILPDEEKQLLLTAFGVFRDRENFVSYLRGKVTETGTVTFPDGSDPESERWRVWLYVHGNQTTTYEWVPDDLKSALQKGGFDPALGAHLSRRESRRKEFADYMRSRVAPDGSLTFPAQRDPGLEGQWAVWIQNTGGMSFHFELLPSELQEALQKGGIRC